MRIALSSALIASLLLLTGASDPAPGPHYTPAGELILPSDYREWVYLSTGLGMSYSEAPQDHSMFDNVFVDPAAWASFKKTGHWPDKTVFMLEIRGATDKGSIIKHGQYQTEERMGLEAHVRDTARFKGGWGFFAFGGGDAPATLLPAAAPCYSCHEAHGAVDTSFTQFYPTARAVAEKAGTFRKD